MGEISVQEMNKIKYIEVDELCTSGLYNALGIYNGTVHLFKNHLEQSKNTTRRYVYAKWAEGTSKELLKKYYRIKNRDEYNKSKAVLHDFKLLTMHHELGHHYSLHYFYKHLHGLWELWDNDCYRYIEEMAADYFGEFSTIGMIQKLSEKRRKRKRAKQLLALVAVLQNERKKMWVAVLQNERKKMWHTIDKYEYVHKVTTPLLLDILNSKNFHENLSRLVKAQNLYIHETVKGLKEISGHEEKVEYMVDRERGYKTDFMRIFERLKPVKKKKWGSFKEYVLRELG